MFLHHMFKEYIPFVFNLLLLPLKVMKHKHKNKHKQPTHSQREAETQVKAQREAEPRVDDEIRVEVPAKAKAEPSLVKNDDQTSTHDQIPQTPSSTVSTTDDYLPRVYPQPDYIKQLQLWAKYVRESPKLQPTKNTTTSVLLTPNEPSFQLDETPDVISSNADVNTPDEQAKHMDEKVDEKKKSWCSIC